VTVESVVDVQISAETRFPTRAGFGTMLVLGYHTAWLERVRVYEELDALADDGITENDPQTGKIYAAVRAAFSQNPRPRQIKVGRRVGAPDQSIRLTPTSVEEGWTYSFSVGGVPFAYTAQAGDAVGDVTAALEALMAADDDAIVAAAATAAAAQELTGAALDGVIGAAAIAPPRNLTVNTDAHADWDATTIVIEGLAPSGRAISESFDVSDGGDDALAGTKTFAKVTKVTVAAQSGAGGSLDIGVGTVFANADLDVTGTDGSTHLDVAANVSGEWFAFGGFDARMLVEDRTAEPATALSTDLDAILEEDPDFYGVIGADAQSQAQITAVAAWTEAHPNPGKLYLAHSIDSDVGTAADDDVATSLLEATYFRSHVHYQRNAHGTFPDAAWMASLFPFDPGSATWDFKELSGVPIDAPSATVRTNLKTKNASYYVRIKGRNVTRHSKTAAGEWLDVVRFVDWTKDQIATDVFDQVSGSPKTPYTQGGIDSVGGRVRQVGRRGVAAGGLDPNQELTVIVPVLSEIDPSEIAERNLPGVTFDWRIAGAIHAVSIRGNVSV